MMSRPSSGPRSFVGSALRGAGLIDSDSRMRDVADQPGGKKTTSKIRAHRRMLVDTVGETPMLPGHARRAAYAHASPSDPLSIRGAGRLAGRLRRNAIQGGDAGAPGTSSDTLMRARVVRPPEEPWREFVQSRWNPETRFLNLENMAESDIVKRHNLTPPGIGKGNKRHAAVIFKLANELKPSVQTLSLANNGIVGDDITPLDKFLPNLENLSLQNNQLRVWKDLESISPRKGKMKFLKELILIGNPLRDIEFKNNRGEQYRVEMTRRFTTLEMLDMEPVVKISFDVGEKNTSSETPTASSEPANDPKTFPCDMGPSFVSGIPDASFLANFLMFYFNAFDAQRQSLLNLYTEHSTFSYSANTAIPARARIENLHHSMPNQHKLTWPKWLDSSDASGGSRNLTRIGGGLDKIVRSLHIGANSIIKAFLNLPGTKHAVNGPPERFVVDAMVRPLGQMVTMMVIVHGEFSEVETEGVRSFDRTFILTPSAEGSPAQAQGFPFVILSDQLIIRSYSHYNAWKPGPMVVQPISQPPRTPSQTGQQSAQQPIAVPQMQPSAQPPQIQFPPDQQAVLASYPEVQREFIVRLCMQTQLNVKMAFDCLDRNGWVYQTALNNFYQVKAQLPREAFL